MARTILIVDDNAVERTVLSGFLRSEYTVLAAHSGKEMLNVLRDMAKEISAIILDLIMPEMDGYEALRRIRENAVYRQIPVLVATSLMDTDSQVKALELGASGYTFKPYNRNLLLHLLENTISLREKSALVNASRRDALTGLPNRTTFFEDAEAMIKRAEPGYYILACFDIENFKVINDQYGSAAGDAVLRHVADAICAGITPLGGICCRYSADRFGLLYPAKYKDSDAIRALHEKAGQPDRLGRRIKIRLGRYTVDDPEVPVSAMYDRATLAEESIRGRYDTFIAEYSESMRTRLITQQKIVNNMDRALAEGEFEPWYQPQYNHATGALIGAEALVRWRQGDLFVPPADFVPVFERNGFIYEMDQYIWENVCRRLRQWIDRGCAPLPVSVNISRCDLFQPGFIDALTGLVKKYDIPFDMLRLEVTESAFAEESGVIVAKVGELIRLGFTVEIDDFGSGYSSLNTLKDVPAGILKLDMKFFENTRNRQRGGNIIESVVRMAKWLGMTVIAEGVEDKEQADYLQTIGCYYIQGYFYAKPMPVDEYEVLLTGSAKEAHLTRLETLTTLDNNEFWNPKSMETLIFNSYVGGACIFEYCDGKSELLRANAQYIRAMGGLIGEGAQLKDSSIVRFLDQDGRDSLVAAINEAIAQRREAFCDVRLSDERHVEYLRVTVRRIARAGERYLFYAVIENMTEQRKAEQKQLESARTLQSVISNVNGSVSAMLLDEIGHSTMIFGNDNYFSLFGYTKEQARAAHLDVMSRIHPDDFSGVVEKLKRLKADGKPVLIDYRGVKRDGSVVEIRSNSSLMRMEGYGDQVIVSVETDITEQRALSDKFRAVIENINGGVSAVYLKEGAPEYAIVNDQYFRIIGYTREQFKAEVASVFDLVHPDDRARVERQFREAGAQRGQYTMEYRFIRRDGAVRHILCNTNVVHLFGVEEPVQLAVSNDITELREAQRKELEAAGKFSAVLNHAGNGITALALNGDKPQFLFMNERYFEIIGYSREEYAAATRDDMAALVHPDDRETIRRRVLSVNESHGSDTIEYRVTRKDGKTIWVRTAVTVTDIPGINAPVQIAVFSDITSQKETAEQLRFLNDSAHDILAQPDSEQAIRDTLQKIVSFFTADRGYVVELDYEKGVSGNTYEVCAPGVRSEMENLRDVPFTKTDFWFGALSRKNISS